MAAPDDGVMLVDKPAGKTSHDVVAAVRGLARLCTDDVIASVLNRNGLVSSNGAAHEGVLERVAPLLEAWGRARA